jgi:hypothetical protein
MKKWYHKTKSRLLAQVDAHIGPLYGTLSVISDGMMGLSGIHYMNFGRMAAGFSGLAANIPAIFFVGRDNSQDAIHPQDLPFKEKMKHIWKFWKYPLEFQATANIAQPVIMAVASGPDTISSAGEITGVETLTSTDQFRPMETAVGVVGTLGFLIMLLNQHKDAQINVNDNRPVLLRLQSDWNAVKGFAVRRAKDLTTEGYRIDKSLKTSFENACLEISIAGPNQVAAKVFNTIIFPWIGESIIIGDWKNVAAGCGYLACNQLLKRIDKRGGSPSLENAPSAS